MVYYENGKLITVVSYQSQMQKICKIDTCRSLQRGSPEFQGYCARHAHEILGIVSTPKSYIPRVPPKPEAVYIEQKEW